MQDSFNNLKEDVIDESNSAGDNIFQIATLIFGLLGTLGICKIREKPAFIAALQSQCSKEQIQSGNVDFKFKGNNVEYNKDKNIIVVNGKPENIGKLVKLNESYFPY